LLDFTNQGKKWGRETLQQTSKKSKKRWGPTKSIWRRGTKKKSEHLLPVTLPQRGSRGTRTKVGGGGPVFGPWGGKKPKGLPQAKQKVFRKAKKKSIGDRGAGEKTEGGGQRREKGKGFREENFGETPWRLGAMGKKKNY